MRSRTLVIAGAMTLTFGACSEPTIPNYNSPTVEARRARHFTPANRKNLAFMTSLLSALPASRPCWPASCEGVGELNRGGCDLFHTGDAGVERRFPTGLL